MWVLGRAVMVVAICLSATGCGWFSDDEDEVLEIAPEIAVRRDPVTEVRDIEIGRTARGFAVTAFGTAPAMGYTAPQLRPRRDGRPAADGFLDYDFLAEAPAPEAGFGAGDARARAIRADVFLSPDELAGVTGIRIHGARGGLQIVF